MRLKFWHWAHDAAERLWHWIYYYRLPEGIARQKHTADLVNRCYSELVNDIKHKRFADEHSVSIKYAARKEPE